ncbi:MULTISPECIES: phenol hydroxylase subunit [Marinobacter]|uniref:phenol hydroxylase subunit n=1 Tax=Marinobacter TaxID=2742 RepID=UPI000C5F13F9|nr:MULTISPECIES: phenol hydroxylase subunit [Marinobacter]MAO12135.1 phenol hydroxylase [Marinobacter sp.]
MAETNYSGDITPAKLDTERRYVRITGERSDGFVEFDFAVGEPELFVEMILSRPAFEEFCEMNQVQTMGPAEDSGPEDRMSDFAWNLRDATGKRFK